MDRDHSLFVSGSDLVQVQAQPGRDLGQLYLSEVVQGQHDLLPWREGLRRVHRSRQHAGPPGLALDVCQVGVIMAGIGGVEADRAADVCLCLVDLGHAYAGPGRQVLRAVANVQAASRSLPARARADLVE